MRVIPGYIASLLAAGAIAAAVAAAPIAAAAPSQGASSAGSAATDSSGSAQPHQSCLTLGGTQSQCQSPGNAQVYDSPPQVDYFPYAGGGT